MVVGINGPAPDNNIEDTQAPNSISKKLETENMFS